MITVGRHQLAVTVSGEGTPVVVIEPSLGGAAADWEKIARALAEQTLAGLSANSRHDLSDSPDHYLNVGDPDLVTAAIRDVVRCARSGALLAEVALSSDGD